MSIFRTGLALIAAIGGIAGASAASAQTDRYAIGPSTPNSDGSRGYGSYVAMLGSSYLDSRRYGDRDDGRVYPVDTAARPAPANGYASTAPTPVAYAQNAPADQPMARPTSR